MRKNNSPLSCWNMGLNGRRKRTHEKHLSVLDFEKKERAKEIAELEQSISDGKERLSDIQIQQRKAEQETEQIRQEGEAIRQEVSGAFGNKQFAEGAGGNAGGGQGKAAV